MVFFWESKQQTNLRFIPFLVVFWSFTSVFTRIFTHTVTRFAVCLKKPIGSNDLTPISSMNFKRFSVPLFSFSSVGVAGVKGSPLASAFSAVYSVTEMQTCSRKKRHSKFAFSFRNEKALVWGTPPNAPEKLQKTMLTHNTLKVCV
jgi:hypothetical protein